jgi:hypothetical protein
VPLPSPRAALVSARVRGGIICGIAPGRKSERECPPVLVHLQLPSRRAGCIFRTTFRRVEQVHLDHLVGWLTVGSAACLQVSDVSRGVRRHALADAAISSAATRVLPTPSAARGAVSPKGSPTQTSTNFCDIF